MKKKVLFILACFWVIISFLLIRITYAKYLTAMSGSSDAHVSFWNITLNNQDILSNSNLTSGRVFTGTSNNNNYQKDMFKILGDVDSNSSKVETDNSTTSSKINKKNEGNK